MARLVGGGEDMCLGCRKACGEEKCLHENIYIYIVYFKICIYQVGPSSDFRFSNKAWEMSLHGTELENHILNRF